MSTTSPPRKRGRSLIYTLMVCAILLIAVYGWKEYRIRNLRERMEQQRAECATRQDEVRQRSRTALLDQGRDWMETLGLPLGWAVTDTVQAGDAAQLREYFALMIKRPAVSKIVFVDAEGTITLTTDQKLQGERVAEFFPELDLHSERTLVPETPSEARLVVPVTGPQGRAGTLIVVFSKEKLLAGF